MSDESAEEQWRRADDEVRKNLPQGVKLVRTLRGHKDDGSDYHLAMGAETCKCLQPERA